MKQNPTINKDKKKDKHNENILRKINTSKMTRFKH